jgi:cytoskeletal protein CcmA (bactofilin family)
MSQYSKEGTSQALMPGQTSPGRVTRPNEHGTSVIAANFQIVGNLSCNDTLNVEGMVEGNIDCHSLALGETGTVKGEVRADTVSVKGTFKGAINARVVNLARTAKVQGDIVATETLGIEPGAEFDGTCKRSRASSGDSAMSTPAKSVAGA